VGWNEKGGTVSRSFDQWLLVDSEIKAFHRFSLLWSEQAYTELWEKAQEDFNEVFDPDRHYGDEHVGYFEDSVGGLWPDRFQWMIHAATIKDAVTAFEVYLEKSAQEVLARPRAQLASGERVRFVLPTASGQESPTWRVLSGFHQFIGNDVSTERICEIRRFRHFLTHQRGEFRSEESLRLFAGGSDGEMETDAEPGPYVGGDVPLTEDRVLRILADLASVVRGADPRVWAIAWGRGDDSLSISQLRELLDKKYVKACLDPLSG
jgi:hypothetical protein